MTLNKQHFGCRNGKKCQTPGKPGHDLVTHNLPLFRLVNRVQLSGCVTASLFVCQICPVPASLLTMVDLASKHILENIQVSLHSKR